MLNIFLKPPNSYYQKDFSDNPEFFKIWRNAKRIFLFKEFKIIIKKVNEEMIFPQNSTLVSKEYSLPWDAIDFLNQITCSSNDLINLDSSIKAKSNQS